jgi:hypothetical protein
MFGTWELWRRTAFLSFIFTFFQFLAPCKVLKFRILLPRNKHCSSGAAGGLIMKTKLSITFSAILFGLLIVSATPAKADFLGLAPGDHTITLLDSAGLCGVSDCVGTVHIGPTDETGFDWLFLNVGAPANDFDFSSTSTALTKTASIDQALEILLPPIPNFPTLSLVLLIGDSGIDPRWFYHDEGGVQREGSWSRTPSSTVPEPMSSSLLLFGLGALGLRGWLRAKQD